MKKLSFFLLICLFLTGCGIKNRPKDFLDEIKLKDKIVVGIKNDSKPFGFVQNGEITGFDADIAKHIAASIFNDDYKEHLEFIPLGPSQRLTALNSGKVDIVIATLSINERRKDIIDFSNPYFEAGQALMVPAGSRISSIEQLNNKKAAVVLGTTGEKTIRMFAPNATSIGAVNYDDAFDYLEQGLVDAILADDSLLYGILSQKRGYKILKPRYTKEYYAIGIRKGSEYASLKKQLNAILNSMQQTGKLNVIKEKWIPEYKMK